jgi:hypothetical protein
MIMDERLFSSVVNFERFGLKIDSLNAIGCQAKESMTV